MQYGSLWRRRILPVDVEIVIPSARATRQEGLPRKGQPELPVDPSDEPTVALGAYLEAATDVGLEIDGAVQVVRITTRAADRDGQAANAMSGSTTYRQLWRGR